MKKRQFTLFVLLLAIAAASSLARAQSDTTVTWVSTSNQGLGEGTNSSDGVTMTLGQTQHMSNASNITLTRSTFHFATTKGYFTHIEMYRTSSQSNFIKDDFSGGYDEWSWEGFKPELTLTFDDPYDVVRGISFTIRDPSTLPDAELSWSHGSFTGYTMIDFNNYKPTLNNPHNVNVRYGLVENEINVKVNPETGYIANKFNVPRFYDSGSYHVYAVHEIDQNYNYDSVVYTLTVDWGAWVSILQNIEEGGNTILLNAVDDLTHAYLITNNSMMACLAPGANFTATANANEGYHFGKWQTGNNIDGYVDYAITDTIVYTAPAEITSMYSTGLLAVFDTNTYALNVVSSDNEKGTVSGSNPAAKHFLNYGISATPNTGYHFVQWNDGITDNPRTVTLTRDSTFTAIFAPDTFTITYMDGTTELNVDTFCYRQPITEYTTSKAGWAFYGWNPAVPLLMPAENLIVYAKWNLVCDSFQDVDGNKYPSVNIGNKCWMAANLKAMHYADGRPITNIYEYQSVMYPDVTENVNIHGRLYNWYDAIDTTTLTVSTRVQGVCPDGWHLPNAEDVAVLNAIQSAGLRSTTGWIGCSTNTNSTGFTAYPSGMFSSSLARYEGMGTETSWWSTVDPDPSTVITPSVVVTAKSLCSSYFCDVIYTKSYLPADAISVRCVKDGQ